MDPDIEYQIRSSIPNTLKINIEKLQSEFQCTICTNPITDAYITRCGHVYCKGCIQQSVNRHHRCPFCNQELKDFKADVFKNYHFNTIKKIVQEQKKKETDKYLNKVFASDQKNQMQAQNNQIQDLMRPIQKKIVQSCQQALLRYRKFLINLYQIQKQTQQKKAIHGLANLRDNKTIIKSFHSFVLDKFPNPVISPQIVEKTTQIHIILPGNKLNKNSLKIAPMATFETLLPYIAKVCSQNNVMLKGKVSDFLIINGVERSIKDKIGLLCGDTIKIQKGIPFQQKVYCFSYNWDKQKTGAFYTCKTCNVKWICQNCALYCHSAHEYQPQIKNHKPDWAMCYCVSKCDCKAINKSNSEH